MAGGGGGGTATTGQLIVRAQKSTNQLKELLAKLLPGAAAEGAAAVEAILSDLSESLSEALESLQLGASSDRRLPARPEASMSGCGRSVASSGDRLVSRRRGQRRRVDGSSRRITLQFGDPGDAYPWRKYGQKDILGAKFARNYYRCAQRSCCSARKHVQQSDDDPSRVEITYIGAHTCDDRSSSPAISHVEDTQESGVSHRRLSAAAAVPPTLQMLEKHLPASDMMACTPSMEEEEMAGSWLFIPSPACSLSELLSKAVEAPELRPDASLAWPVEHKKECDDGEFLALYDSVVPDLM